MEIDQFSLRREEGTVTALPETEISPSLNEESAKFAREVRRSLTLELRLELPVEITFNLRVKRSEVAPLEE